MDRRQFGGKERCVDRRRKQSRDTYGCVDRTQFGGKYRYVDRRQETVKRYIQVCGQETVGR